MGTIRSGYEPEGRVFESLRAHHIGSNCGEPFCFPSLSTTA